MKFKNKIKVAIDSPAAAGAGTQAKLISKHFNLFYLDTGKIYRLIANIKLTHPKKYNYTLIKKIMSKLDIKDLQNKKLLSDEVGTVASIISKNIRIRNKNFEYLKNFFSKFKNYFHLPEQYAGVKTPWLAFPLVIKENKKFSRKQMQIYFEKNNIQTRTIFTGNILKQPAMKNRYYKKHAKCSSIANDVMKNGILLGCHQGMVKEELDYICNKFLKFIEK